MVPHSPAERWMSSSSWKAWQRGRVWNTRNYLSWSPACQRRTTWEATGWNPVGKDPSCPFSEGTFKVFLTNPFLEIPYKCNFASLVLSPRENLLVKTELAGGEEKEIKVLSHLCFCLWPKQQPAMWHSDLFHLNLIFCQEWPPDSLAVVQITDLL